MKKVEIVTVTLSPSLDKSTHFSGLVAEQKIRCETPQYDAGGGGINVSKAIARLGGISTALFTSGGPIGKALEHLVENEKFHSKIIETKSWTRENFIAFDNESKSQYRFGFPGPQITNGEQVAIKNALKEIESGWLVISGSLNEGLSTDFYAGLITIAKSPDIKIVIDTSGDALQKALEAGVYLAKPNVGELAKLIGTEKLDDNQVESAAKKLIEKGNAEIVVVSLGAKGAMLVSKEETHFVPAPDVVKKSTVGAGDSMVGAVVWALSQNRSLKEALQWGVACGSAATMNEGTQLFKREDAEQLFEIIKKKK